MEVLEVEDPEGKRKVIESFVHRITIYVDRINITYKVDPSDSNKIRTVTRLSNSSYFDTYWIVNTKLDKLTKVFFPTFNWRQIAQC